MKKYYILNNTQFDSLEEIDFQHWINEATQAGLIISYKYQPEPFLLTPKQTHHEVLIKDYKNGNQRTYIKDKHLLAAHTYRADHQIEFRSAFEVVFPNHGLKKFDLPNKEYQPYYFIDVKGTFDRNKSLRIFSIDQKLVYDKYGIYVNKVVPGNFFMKTWVPVACAFMKNRRELTMRKPYQGCKLLEELKVSGIFNR